MLESEECRGQDASNVVMLVMFPVMNLMLVNLLIAIMNDTYTDVKGRSKLQWMLQMYHVSKEYRSSARLNLATLLWDVLQFGLRKSEVDSRCEKLRSPQPGLRGWFQDLRFKYKRFQTRDLPALDKKSVQVELSKRVDQLEAMELGSASKNVRRTLAVLWVFSSVSSQSAGWQLESCVLACCFPARGCGSSGAGSVRVLLYVSLMSLACECPCSIVSIFSWYFS
eukprot:3523741-Rhodomonas_salina.2